MKKFALALMAAAAVTFGFGGVASAYPPGGEEVTTSDSSVEPGGSVTISANCTLGELVTFTLVTSSDTATCSVGGNNQAVGGVASGTVTAPVAPGTYTGTVTGSVSGDLGTFTVVVAGQTATTVAEPTPTVPSGGLPATGSDGIGATTGIAIGLLVVGLGLFAVATVRRRTAVA